jgi:hypothetical protein
LQNFTEKNNIGKLTYLRPIRSNWQQNMRVGILKNSSFDFFNRLQRYKKLSSQLRGRNQYNSMDGPHISGATTTRLIISFLPV